MKKEIIDVIKLSKSGVAVTSSRVVAEVFERRHSNILRAIEDLHCSESFFDENYTQSTYVDSKGEHRKEYEITKEGMAYLATGFTGQKAGEIKEAFLKSFDMFSSESQVAEEVEGEQEAEAKPVINLVNLSQDGKQPVTTSLIIAEAFGKRHDNILQSIKNLDCGDDFANLNFQVCFKNNDLQNGKPQRYYEITKDGMAYLVMGFTGTKAAKFKVAYINEFNRMADILNQRQERGREINDFLKRDSISVQNGTIHGKGLALRKKEKRELKEEFERINSKYQMLLGF
ncbi:MAG: Rha family transcriptional regulator [Enterovibrio sp.]